jgi:hypothetical protein
MRRRIGLAAVWALTVVGMLAGPGVALSLTDTPPVPIKVHILPPKLTPANCSESHGTKETAPPAREVPGPTPPAPTGLITSQIYGVGKTPFQNAVFGRDGRFTTGVDLLIQWCNLEPRENVFDWKPLDHLFKQAAPRKGDPNGKFIDLTIVPGFETPRWALRGVPTVTSGFAYGGPVAARRLPQPWNKTYLSRWLSFMAAVAGRYGDNTEFRMVEAAGPTSVSTEMTLPNWRTRDNGLPTTFHRATLNHSDVAMWRAWHYSEPKLIGAWSRVFAAYHRMFRNQYVGLALFPGLPLNSDGSADSGLGVQTELDVVAAGKYYDPGRMIVQEDGLDGSGNDSNPSYSIVRANCGSATTGYQTRVPNKVIDLRDAVRHAIDSNVEFMEIYQTDVLNDPTTLSPFAPRFPANAGCKPLSLTATPNPDGGSQLKATTDLELTSTESINVFEVTPSGDDARTTCTASKRSASCALPRGVALAKFEADVGAPGTLPYSPEAFVSATTSAETTPTTSRGRPPCTGTRCF